VATYQSVKVNYWSRKMHLRTQIGVSVVVMLTLFTTASAQDWRRPESRDRGKDFVGFIQPDHLYWRPFVLPSVQPAEFKLLSLDESTHARTQILSLPPGWKQVLGYHSTDLEMFVLEGGIEIGGKAMERYSYAYYPAGYAHEFSTGGGATVLQWWGGKPDFVQNTESKPGTPIAEVIEGWNYGDAPSISPSQFPGFRAEPVWENSPIRLKLLRHDKRTGRMTWIAMIPGGGPPMSGEDKLPPWASNPSWQEGFLLAGDMTTAECLPVGQVAGSYGPGGYFFRPAGLLHGGVSEYSTTFALWLFRSGKAHWVDYHDSCDQSSPPAPGKESDQR
jgi:hypothetical protein